MSSANDRTITQALLDHWTGSSLDVPAESKQYYLERLAHGVWMLEFVKADGTTSLMECTLDERLLPPTRTDTTPRPEPAHLIHVYALDRGGWRSFRTANVKNFYPKSESM